MLQTLTLRNIALIESLQVDFHRGLHVLSGETGAGKSIVVDAVGLILGSRADRDIIRTGTERAFSEAVFTLAEGSPAWALLDREQIDHDEETITVCRELSTTGKNVCRICGVMMPLAFLRELAPFLMDIHGQHEHQFLMDPEMHLGFLDRTGDEKHAELMRKTEAACAAFMDIHRQYAKLVRMNERKQERIKTLEGELETLHEAKLRPGEEEELAAEYTRLQNAEKIRGALQEAYGAIALGDRDGGCMDRIRNAQNRLKTLIPYGEKMESLHNRCESLYYELEELGFDLYQAMEQNDAGEGRLEQVENRLDLIRRLERKHGDTIEAVLAAQQAMEEEYSALCALDDQISTAAAEHKKALAQYRSLARQLTECRRELADAFEHNMKRELSELGMGGTIFEVHFAERSDGKKPLMPRPNGDDDVEFMISPNPGEPVKPLAKIASGGELSRLMLAIKSLEAGRSGVESMVFDEIDTGISGRMAQVVAEKMRAIAARRQVICVTHLPQIAAAADHEYLVHKDVTDGRTVTTVRELDREGRISEVARMVSGAEGVTEDAARYAQKMLDAYPGR